MKAYNQGITKKEFVAELKKHKAADAFVKGQYWDGKKGCAVGCGIKSISTIKSLNINIFSQHNLLQTHLGIPEWLARLQDTLFEGMSVKKSKTWPVNFAAAINTGADLESVKSKFVIVVLKHSLKSVKAAKYDKKANPEVFAAIEQTNAAVKQMIAAQESGNSKDIIAAGSAAESAWSAWSAARYAAESAAGSAARYAAFDYYASELLKILKDTK